MGVDCSCMRIDMLEDKTIITGSLHHRAPSNAYNLQSEHIEKKEEFSLPTLENTDSSQFLLTSLSRRYLAKKFLSFPSNFFNSLPHSLDFYVPEPIKEIEKLLYQIPCQVSPEVYKLSSSEIYQGGFDTYLRKTGFGLQLINNEKYLGVFVLGKREGYGRIIKANMNVYEGDFVNGEMNGEGNCIENGIRYKGMFKNGLKSGVGREEWPDKSVYFGEFLKNLKHGHGKFEWGNENKFEGQFVKGDISGTGVFLWKNGKRYQGQWKKNKMHGFGQFTWPNGKKYIGYYKRDMKHGKGTLVWPDGREYEGHWKNGLQHGIGYYKWFNKLKDQQEQRKGEWEKGTRVQWLGE